MCTRKWFRFQKLKKNSLWESKPHKQQNVLSDVVLQSKTTLSDERDIKNKFAQFVLSFYLSWFLRHDRVGQAHNTHSRTSIGWVTECFITEDYKGSFISYCQIIFFLALIRIVKIHRITFGFTWWLLFLEVCWTSQFQIYK